MARFERRRSACLAIKAEGSWQKLFAVAALAAASLCLAVRPAHSGADPPTFASPSRPGSAAILVRHVWSASYLLRCGAARRRRNVVGGDVAAKQALIARETYDGQSRPQIVAHFCFSRWITAIVPWTIVSRTCRRLS